MLQRQYSYEDSLHHKDILSGNSKVALPLAKWVIGHGSGNVRALNAIIFSFDKTPMELLSYVSNVSNIILNGNGEIGTIVGEKNYKR